MSILSSSLRTVVAIAAAVLLSMPVQPPAAGDSVAKEHVVEIRNLEFSPKELTVTPGDTITWINYDFIPHTVTADDESWDSGLIEAEGKWQTVVKKGMYETYFCRYHPNMKAQITVAK